MNKCVIVDNEEIILKSLTQLVDWEGFGFSIAKAETSPVRTLDYIKQNPDTALLITDVVMPEMSGLKLIEQVKHINPALPVIVISAFDEFDYVRGALRLGAENYLLKPVDIEELSDSLRQLSIHIEENKRALNPGPLHTFKSNITERWLKNTISSHELLDKADILGINISAKFRAVCIKTFECDAASVFGNMTELFAGRICGYPFFEDADIFTAVLYDGDIQGAVETLQPKFGHTAIALGVCADFENISKSYASVCRLKPLLYTGCNLLYADKIDEKYNMCSDIPMLETALHSSYALAKQLSLKEAQAACVRLFELGGVLPDKTDIEILKMRPSQEQKLYGWVCSLISNMLSRLEAPAQLHPSIIKALGVISGEYGSDLSLKTLSDKLGLSSAYLGRLFREQIGMHFNDYLLEERLKHACEMLRSTALQMSDIAAKCGFSSQTYFNRSFKRVYGISPLAYRHHNV